MQRVFVKNIKTCKVSFGLIILILFIYIKPLKAQVLFEGYSKITLSGQFLGFVIQKYEFNVQKKNFISTSLIKYNEAGGGITESLKAYANEALEPISYSYNLLSPTGAKTIEASFTKGTLTVKTTERGKTTKKDIKLPKGSFFSSFLAYVILKNPQGLKTSSKYEYQAIAEEDGEIYKGSATVQSEETYKGLRVYKILNDYKGAQFVSLTTDKGEMISTTAPQKSLSLELVAEPSQAMGGLSVGADNLKLLFGNIPEGKINALAGPAPMPQNTNTTQIPTKVVPAGSTSSSLESTPSSSTPSPSSVPSSSSPSPSTTTSPSSPTTTSKLKKLEPKFSDADKGKKGAPAGLGIQTKPEK